MLYLVVGEEEEKKLSMDGSRLSSWLVLLLFDDGRGGCRPYPSSCSSEHSTVDIPHVHTSSSSSSPLGDAAAP